MAPTDYTTPAQPLANLAHRMMDRTTGGASSPVNVGVQFRDVPTKDDPAARPPSREGISVHDVLGTQLSYLVQCHNTLSVLEDRLSTVTEPVPAAPESANQTSMPDPYSVLDKLLLQQRVTVELDSRLQRLLRRLQL